MRLKELTVVRKEWGENVGKLEGKIILESPRGEITTFLDPARSDAIIAVIADLLVEETIEIARVLKTEAITHEGQKVLEPPEDGETNDAT